MSTLEDAFEGISRDELFGFIPRDVSMKPAHIANGLFRALIGRQYDPLALNNTLVHLKRDREVTTNQELVARYPEIFAPYRDSTSWPTLTNIRHDMKVLLAPFGGAVNQGNRRSTYNITADFHLTADSLDKGVGRFLYELLTLDLGTGESVACRVIRDALQRHDDDISLLTTPLATDVFEPVNAGTYPASTVFRRRTGRLVSPSLRAIRAGFDSLAGFESRAAGGLDSLRRLVAFGVLGVLLHIHGRGREGNRGLGPAPVMLHFLENESTTAHLASHATYNLNRRAIETLYAEEFMAWLALRLGESPRKATCERFVDDLEFDEDPKRHRSRILQSFRAFEPTRRPIEALGEAVRAILFEHILKQKSPCDFYRTLGARLGLVKPRGNRAVRKFYTLDGVLLEAVLASVLAGGELTYPRLLQALYDAYGFIVGGRRVDPSVLESNGVSVGTVHDLKRNSAAFKQRLISLGWAQQYADGVMVARMPEGLM
jgi:hypothetical protein